MKLENIKIENFKGIEETTLNPAKLNVLVGHNGTGKTSTLEALRYLITGQFDSESIRKGESVMLVTGKVGNDEIKRGRKKKNSSEEGDGTAVFKLNGKTTTAKSYNEYIDKTTSSDINAVELITSKELMDMDVDTLTNFLLTVVPTSVDFDKLVSLCPNITPQMISEMEMLLPEKGITLENIKEADDFYTAARKTTKIQLEAKKSRAEYNGVVPTETKEEVQSQLDVIIGKEAAYLTTKDAIDNYNKVLQAIKTQKEQINNYKKEADELKCTKPNQADEDKLNKNIELFRKSITDLTGSNRVLNNSKEMFEKTLNNLSKNTCPLSDKLVCMTDKTSIKTELEESIKEAAGQIENNLVTIKNVTEKLLDGEVKLKEIHNQKTKHAKYIQVLKTIETLEKNIPCLPNKPVDIKENQNDIADAKRMLQQKLSDIAVYEKAMIDKKHYDTLLVQKDLYESLCRLFDEKSGIREKILEFALNPFEDYVNNKAKSLGLSFEIKIQVNKGVRILCRPDKCSGFIPYKNASMGEQIQVAFLIMNMLNELTHTGILIMDNLDKLDENALSRIMDLLTMPKVLAEYDHIFLAMVDHIDAINTIKLLPVGTNVINMN